MTAQSAYQISPENATTRQRCRMVAAMEVGLVEYTLSYLLTILEQAAVLTAEQSRQARLAEPNIRQRILRDHVATGGRKAAAYDVTPAEIMATFEFVSPDGRPLDEDRIMQVIANDSKLTWVKPDPLKLNADLIVSTMTRPFARRHSCVVLKKDDGKIVIAVDNPYNLGLIQQLGALISDPIEIVVCSRSDIHRIITEVYGFRSSINAATEGSGGGQNIGNLEQLVRLTDVGEIEATDKPVVNAVEYLLHYAFDQRASDIHIEPKREHTIIRFRIDGILHNVYTLPRAVHAPLVSRLKMLSRMDIAEKRRPQDGRIKIQKEGRDVELRLSTLPVAFGEKIVVRIFDPQHLIQALDSIGFFKEDLTAWRTFMNRPTGLVLVTGPTGSGKTTTLYSTLKELAGPDVNITTVEDPIEMVYEEFNQVLVQRKIEVTFAQALRTILRQDPDIIMVGEIRDAETAAMAVQSALTGHLVFSTMHTNDTASTITRLLELDVEPFLLASTLVGVMAQRLVRRICTSCKVETHLTREQIDILEIKLPPSSGHQLPVHIGEGCVRCRGTGYYGRVGLFELMSVDESVRKLIGARASSPDVRRAARANGMMSLREAAIKRMAQGLTTFEEVISVTVDN